jgi:N-methylhydantoinase B
MAGAGGHGDPLARDTGAVLNDVLDERITVHVAFGDYAVVITEDRTVDAAATEDERARRRQMVNSDAK